MSWNKFNQRNRNKTVHLEKMGSEWMVRVSGNTVIINKDGDRKIIIHEGSLEHCRLIRDAYLRAYYDKGVDESVEHKN